MRDIVADTFINDMFFMADSSDYFTGVTSLGFANSGDMQLSKNGGAFADISGNVGIIERGFGWYSLVGSITGLMNTVGKNVIHIIETESVSSIPSELVLNVVLNDVHSLSAQNSTQITSFSAETTSNFNALSTQITGLDSTTGKIVAPFATVVQNDPLDVRQKTHYDATFYIGQAFSSFATQPVWFTGKQKASDSSDLWSVQGTVSNATSMSCVFSLSATQTNQELTEHGLYEIQFRKGDDTIIKDAMVGTLRILKTLKLT